MEAGPSPVSKMNNNRTDEHYKLVELSDHEILVEFKDGSSANPNNWDFVCILCLDCAWRVSIGLTNVSYSRIKRCTMF